MSDESYSFSTARVRLEEIVTQVRKKDTSLEKSLDLLEEGVRLANSCTELIDRADWTVGGVGEEAEDAEDGAGAGGAAVETESGEPAADASAGSEPSDDDDAEDASDDTWDDETPDFRDDEAGV